MAWNSVVNILSNASMVTTVNSIESTGMIQLNPGESAHVEIEATWGTTFSEDMLVEIITSNRDSPVAATSSHWDVSPFQMRYISSPGVANTQAIGSLIVSGVRAFKVRLKKTGTSNSLTAININVAKDGVSI